MGNVLMRDDFDGDPRLIDEAINKGFFGADELESKKEDERVIEGEVLEVTIGGTNSQIDNLLENK